MKRRACAIAAACAAASAAADVVVFENTNSDFDLLHETVDNGDVVSHGQYLDITADAFNQPDQGTVPPHGITILDEPVIGGTFLIRNLLGSTGTSVASIPNQLWVPSPKAFKTSDVIGPDEDWSLPTLWVHYLPNGGTTHMTREIFTAGVRFELDGQTHYGFATLQREVFPLFLAPRWTALQWGYETEPDTPLVLPTSCVGDYAEPYGALDFFDATAFLNAYTTGAPIADLAEPFGAPNFVDLIAFLVAYNERCP